HVNTAPPPLRRLRPDATPAAIGVVARAMAKEPGSRFGGAGEMRAAIEAARGGPGLGFGVTTLVPVVEAAANWRWPLLGAAGLILLLVVAAVQARANSGLVAAPTTGVPAPTVLLASPSAESATPT